MIDKPDIIQTAERLGIDLQQRGKSYWFKHHGEKTASARLSVERQNFHCFGCGAHGDALDLVQEQTGLTFKDACKYLGITPGRPQPIDPEIARQKALKKAFEAWRMETYIELCDELIDINHLRICASRRKPLPESLAFWLADKLALLPQIEHELDVLGFDTFEAYCKSRWDFSRRNAYYLIDAASVVDNVKHVAQNDSPSSLRQTIPLARLEPDQQREAWQNNNVRNCGQIEAYYGN
ncbi:MAG: hypothetical protein CVU54_14700 [Deltaproteobacteria bacterium HGW-Deltaproteobacteria-12]|jgi:hypothetical protein|nr:MAG: hypothetical protein CVU54_14700 [Deltaproteobacteria bacterium HGW-Deltaproteobacteria-12]